MVRGGRALLARRGQLAAAGLTRRRGGGQWEAARLFLTADGEKEKALGTRRSGGTPARGGWSTAARRAG